MHLTGVIKDQGIIPSPFNDYTTFKMLMPMGRSGYRKISLSRSVILHVFVLTSVSDPMGRIPDNDNRAPLKPDPDIWAYEVRIPCPFI